MVGSDQFPASSWKGIHSGKQTFNFSTANIGMAPTQRVVGCMGSVDKTVKFRRKQELPFISLNMCTVDGEWGQVRTCSAKAKVWTYTLLTTYRVWCTPVWYLKAYWISSWTEAFPFPHPIISWQLSKHRDKLGKPIGYLRIPTKFLSWCEWRMN